MRMLVTVVVMMRMLVVMAMVMSAMLVMHMGRSFVLVLVLVAMVLVMGMGLVVMSAMVVAMVAFAGAAPFSEKQPVKEIEFLLSWFGELYHAIRAVLLAIAAAVYAPMPGSRKSLSPS